MGIIHCGCGCGNKIEEFDNKKRRKKYMHGHRKDYHHSEETKSKIGFKNSLRVLTHKEILRLQELAKKRIGIPLTFAHKQKISKSLKGKPTWNKGLTNIFSKEELEKRRKAFSGVNNPRWNGGDSCDIYDNNFTTGFKKRIRELDNHCCVICGTNQINLNRTLSIHHIDLNKKNTCIENCVCLCDSCHNKIHLTHTAQKWIPIFKKIVDLRQGVGPLVCKLQI